MAGCKGVLHFVQLLRGKKAAKFRESMATLLERHVDADMGLADDITDRALQTHLADLKLQKGPMQTTTVKSPAAG